MRSLPKGDRINTDRQFYDEYRQCTLEENKEVHDAYGDTVVLLKKQKRSPNREIDTTGSKGPRGRLDGHRVSYPTGAQPTQTTYGRPEADADNEDVLKEYSIPALVDLSGSPRQVDGGGISISTQPSITISKYYLDEQNLEIDPVEDKFSYQGSVYRIRNRFPRVNFLNTVAEYVYEIE